MWKDFFTRGSTNKASPNLIVEVLVLLLAYYRLLLMKPKESKSIEPLTNPPPSVKIIAKTLIPMLRCYLKRHFLFTWINITYSSGSPTILLPHIASFWSWALCISTPLSSCYVTHPIPKTKFQPLGFLTSKFRWDSVCQSRVHHTNIRIIIYYWR